MCSFTLDQFKESCDSLTFHVIGRKVTAIHPYFLMAPTENEINVAKESIISIAYDVRTSAHCVIFAIAVYRLGMSEVLCRRDINVEGLGQVFDCFNDPKSRLEIKRYYAMQMLDLRQNLRYEPDYVNILLKSAMKSPKVIQILSADIYGGQNIMLFCGLSMYALLMACTPSEIFEDERHVQIVTMCQLEWRMQRNSDLGAFLRQKESPKDYDCFTFMPEDFMSDYDQHVSGYHASSLLLSTPAERIDVWGNTGDDCMESISLLLDAAADGSPSLGVLGTNMPIRN